MVAEYQSGSRAQRDARPLTQQMELSDEEIARRKRFLELGDADVERLEGLNELAQQYADAVIGDFYQHLLSFEDTRAYFNDPRVLEYVQLRQKEYFLRLTQGHYDTEYIENRVTIGAVHERIGLPVKSYLGMYNFYLRSVAGRLFEAYVGDPARALAPFRWLM